MHQFLKSVLKWNYIFRAVPLSIIRSFPLYTQQWYKSYRFADSLQAGSGCSVNEFLIINQLDAPISQICFEMKLYIFRAVLLSIIRSFPLYTRQRYISYRFADSLQAGSEWKHIPLSCVQWETPDDGRRNCPKHVKFHSKNKFEKLVHIVGFYYKKFNTIYCHMKVKLE